MPPKAYILRALAPVSSEADFGIPSSAGPTTCATTPAGVSRRRRDLQISEVGGTKYKIVVKGSIAFRVQSGGSKYEYIYLRPTVASSFCVSSLAVGMAWAHTAIVGNRI